MSELRGVGSQGEVVAEGHVEGTNTQNDESDFKTRICSQQNCNQYSVKSRANDLPVSMDDYVKEKMKPKIKSPLQHIPNSLKQRDREFEKRKAHILENLGTNACDLSPKGAVDVKCQPIMAILNTHDDYITTSSCSGRIALFHSNLTPNKSGGGFSSDENGSIACVAEQPALPGRKRGTGDAMGWLAVKHGVLRAAEMQAIVRYLCGPPANPAERALDAAKTQAWREQQGEANEEAYQGELEGALLEENDAKAAWLTVDDDKEDATVMPAVPTFGMVCLKMEPFVMHVECRNMEGAKKLLSTAVSDAGYRNSGVIPPGKRIMCAMRCTNGCGMEVPVVCDGVNYVREQRSYVWALLKLANEKMMNNENKVKLLCECIKRRLS